jgi:hypothetical protein
MLHLVSEFCMPNIQLKSLAYLLTLTWQPVTWLAVATQALESPRR